MSYIRAHFRVYCTTHIGQTIGLGGSSHSLGSYEREKAIKLVTTPDSYPIWYTESPILLLKEDVEISYKYCIIEGGKAKCFEQSPRKLNIKGTEDDVIIEDRFESNHINASENDSEADLLMKIQEYKNIGDAQNVAVTKSRLVIACYHLPVKITRSNNKDEPFTVAWSESLIAKSKDSVSTTREVVWYGTVTVSGDPLTKDEENILRTILQKINCHPIFIAKELTDDAYLGFCKMILWPIFHNVDQLDQIHAAWYLPSEVSSAKVSLDWNETSAKYHTAFKIVTKSFFDALFEVVKAGDIIWVHDYHMALLPKLLRESIKDISIVFFLHIPFPTSQIFRTLPESMELLYSMTCADVVGFHSFDHARHFLNATKRSLGIPSSIRQGGMLSLKVSNDREVIVTMSHVSVEPDVIDEAVNNPEVKAAAMEIRKKYAGKKIIVAVDVCQRLSGGSLKFAAYEKLLNDYSSTVGNVVLIQKSIRPNNRELDEMTTSADLIKMTTLINSKFSHKDQQVIDYEEVHSLSTNERVALWLAADVFLLTSIREGLNLYPLEYLYARKDLDFTGVVVASEYTACSSLLSGSLKVNPYYILNVADTLHRALEMSATECKQRLQRDLPFVANHPSSKWTNAILYDLELLQSSREKNKIVNSSIPSPGRDEFATILKSYESASDQGIAASGRRVFVFDYGGTLIDKEKSDVYMKHSLSAISGRLPTAKMMESIRRLSQDPQNIVMVVTGLTKIKLGDVFKNMKNVSIATSSGLIYSWGDNLLSVVDDDSSNYIDESTEKNSAAAVAGEAQRRWGCLDFNIDWEAVRDIALPIMTRFTFRTNGTCLYWLELLRCGSDVGRDSSDAIKGIFYLVIYLFYTVYLSILCL